MKAEWCFIWLVAIFDIAFFWQYRSSADIWERNPIAMEIYNCAGFFGLTAIKVAGLVFAMFLSRIRPIITHFAAVAYFGLASFYVVNLFIGKCT